jgi:hypothetical protein
MAADKPAEKDPEKDAEKDAHKDAHKDAQPSAEPNRDRFREALERKRGQQHANNAAAHNDSKVHGEHARASGKRAFRRKSGG